MIASNSEGEKRARPPHSERLSAVTGVKGVHKAKRNRVTYPFTASDGRRTSTSVRLSDHDEGRDVLQQICKRLKHAGAAASSKNGGDGGCDGAREADDREEDTTGDGTAAIPAQLSA